MTLNEYQTAALATARYPDKGANPIYPVLGLAEETGEVVGKVKKMIRDDGGELSPERRSAIKKELGDVLWYLAAASFEFGYYLDEIAEANLEKVHGRIERGTLGGSGDDR